ncbi:glycerol-3-phosphate dehydrogenase [Thermincola ferriacetica]|uniref:Glycerol-3-phosphate dehydrogenase [NAD(P)+] n=1 Tax=Thermincola ferriacetica TaxID=281456 RepID=A0A0L6W649_9FIRM|nr:NAD(P)H-dependent glycerol-3-phosphate dehydrogenase [Thermincola ferriacetica]KNZ70926.1 glycerol-3-phosphate dehydrogenase [Thermincola ferriacetica]
MPEQIAVIGAGSWGTALAVVLAKNGHTVELISNNPEQIEEIRETGENSAYLPGVKVPSGIYVHGDMEESVKKAGIVLLGIPSHAVREVVRQIKPYLNRDKIVVNAAKGLEENTMLRMSQVFEQETGGTLQDNFVVLTGPSHAEEVGREMPTAIVAAGRKRMIAEKVQDIFMSPNFRVYTNPDIVGVEIGGALKNVIAICTGVAEGLGLGDNSKAALITRGLAEIARLGVKLGANPLTFAGLTGIGDLIVTCTSPHSRNRKAGLAIGRGKSVPEAIASVKMVVEGFRTTRAAWQLAREQGVVMPITEKAYEVLYEGRNPREAVYELMTREKKHEIEDVISSTYPDW